MAVLGVVACSGASHGLSESAACSALDTCCASLGGAEASSCHSTVTSATDAQCSAALSNLVQTGGCTGVSYDGGVVDSGLPCTVTGTCPGGSSSSGGSSNSGSSSSSGGSGPDCVPSGACQDGTTYETCSETSASGTCSAAIVFTDGTTYPCASCTNCAAASVSAQSYCTAQTLPEAGPACTAAPTLHAETVAGVYCPFTTAGAIHCASAQECCETPSTVVNGSTCQVEGAACPVAGSLAWNCNGPVDCVGNAAGPVCCGAGTLAVDPTCGFERGTGFTGTHCATSCAAGEQTICAATTDPCPTGSECTPFKVAGIDLGACL